MKRNRLVFGFMLLLLLVLPLALLLLPKFKVEVQGQSLLRVSELDGSPDSRIYWLRVPNGRLGVSQGVGALTFEDPLSFSSPLVRTGNAISINNAQANSSTKGAATFRTADFNDNGAGLIDIDYTNGQAASGTNKGFLTSANWTTFNNKVSSQWVTTGANIYYNGGNVGIGTTNPVNNFVVSNGAGTDLFYVLPTGSAGTYLHLIAGGGVVANQGVNVGPAAELEIVANAPTSHLRCSTCTSFSLMDIGSTATVNLATLATALTLGATTGTTTIRNALTVGGNTAINPTTGIGGVVITGPSAQTLTLDVYAAASQSALLRLGDSSSGNVIEYQSDTAGNWLVNHYGVAGGVFQSVRSGAVANTLVLNTGKVGIGTTTPGRELEVNGGMRLSTATGKPTCNSSNRGTFWAVASASGTKDTVEVCAKDAADAYAWRAIY